jgi:predicted ester cyclase
MANVEQTQREHERFVRELYEYWNSGDMESFYANLDPNVRDANAAPGEEGREGVERVLNHIRSAMPDIRYTVDDVVSDGIDRYAAFLTVRGTQTGELFGDPPTGKTAEWQEVRLCRNRDGKVIEHRAIIDGLRMKTQLGHIKPANRESW